MKKNEILDLFTREYEDKDFNEVFDFFTKKADIKNFKENHKEYFLDLIKDFFDYYNNNDFIILKNEEKNLEILYKNINSKIYELANFKNDLDCFINLKKSISYSNINNSYYGTDLEKDFNLYFVRKKINIQKNMENNKIEEEIKKNKENLNKYFEDYENNNVFSLKSEKFHYDRINSGNFTDYEISNMYSKEDIERYKIK